MALPLWVRCLCFSFLISSQAYGANVVFGKNGKTSWQITTGETNATAQFAAAQLQQYLSQISGCRFKVTTRSQTKQTISVGLRSKLTEQDRRLLPPSKEGYDGYAIAIVEKPERIIIAGDNESGTIYGVYDFLEHVGCRWFYPTQDANDPEVIPKTNTLTIPVRSWSVASPIRYRICNGSSWFFQMDYAEAIKQVDWAMKNRYNAVGWQSATTTDKKSLEQQYRELESAGVLAELIKRGMFIHGPAHSFDHFLRSDDYFDQHPDWFGVRDGKRSPQSFAGAQFCWSNADARKQFVKNAEAFITNAPLIHIFCTIPFDGGKACDCEKCKKAGSSNLLMILLGELIEQLKTSRPDVLVETVGGYGAVDSPPTDLTVIHPNQRIVWAHWGRHHGQGYDDSNYGKRDNLEGWRKAAKGGLTICQYYTDNFAEPWVMGPFTTAMQSDRRYFLSNHIDALYMLMYPRGYWWNHSLNGYIGGRCFYDPTINPSAEIRDYAMHYFGSDAGPLLADYYSEWAKNIDLSYRVRGDSRKEDRTLLTTQRAKLINPAVEAAKGSAIYSYRVSKVERLHTLAENLTEAHRLHDAVMVLRRDGRFDEASIVLDKAKVQTDKVMALFDTLADLNQGLIEKKEIPAFIKMAVKNWIDVEAKAIAAKDRIIPPNPWRPEIDADIRPADLTK